MSGYPTNYGRRLNAEWRVHARHALFHKDGSWYMPLERFPGALFDPNGYVLFKTEEEYRRCPHIRIGQRLSVPGGIDKMPGYRTMR